MAALLLLSRGPALAQERAAAPAAPAVNEAASDAERARSVFREGLDLVDEERWAEAADRFRRVLAIRWSAAAAHNLGSALVELGKLVEAREQLRRVVEDATAAPAIHAAAQRMLEAITPRIGELVIRVAGDAQDLELVLDGNTLPSGGDAVPIPIDPGYHVVLARREGVEVAREEIYLGSGARTIAVDLDPSEVPPEFEPPSGPVLSPLVAAAPTTAPVATPVATASARERRDGAEPWWLWVGGGVLVTALVTAAVVLIANQDESAPEPLPGDLEPRILRGRVEAP